MTNAGGMIALGIGVHGWDADTCISKFRFINTTGLSSKLLTKTWLFGVVARWVRGSIYESGPLERALRLAYQEELLFGLRPASKSHSQNTPRVAITTTVQSERKLFTNYNCGGTRNYLKSNSRTWEV